MTDANEKEDENFSVGFMEPSRKLDDYNNEDDEHENPSKSELVKQSAQRLQDATAPQTGVATEDKIMRFVWILAYIGLFLIFGYQTTVLGVKYIGYPTQVEIQIISRSNLNFPAVTVCNNNPVRKSLIGRIQDHHDLILLDEFVMKSVYKFAESSFDGIAFEAETCKDTDFPCANGKYCVPEPWICNGINNCKDNSDEEIENCDNIKKTRQQELEYAKNSSRGICRDGFIQCPGEIFCATACDNNIECQHEVGFDESFEAGCTLSSCGANFTATTESKSFTSPGFQSVYPNNLNCSWIITAPPGEVVEITFNQISIEGEMGDCEYDFVQMRDGSTSKSGAIRVDKRTRVCGKKIPKESTHKSTNETMTILFRTDETVNFRGFEISYKAVMKETRTRRQADISFNDLVSFDSLSVLSTKNNEDAQIERTRRSGSDYSNNISGDNGNDYDATTSDYSGSQNDTENDYGSSTDDYSTDEDYDYDYSYDYDYDDYGWEDYYDWLDYLFPDTDQFFGIDSEDYFSLFDAAELPDFADFRLAIVFEKDSIRHNGHSRKDFIIQCTYDGSTCSESAFKTYQDPYYGNCFSFNSIRDANLSKPFYIKKTSKTGQEYGLKLTLFVDMQEYIGLFAPYGGARVLIHDASSNGRVRAEGLSIPVGESTFLAVKQNTVERQGGKYSDCAEDWPNFLQLNNHFKKQWSKYSREVCLELCVQNALALKCNCTDTFDMDFSLDEAINAAAQYYCVMTQKPQYECKKEIYRQYVESNITCPCPQACKTTTYSHVRSGSPWPTEAFTPYLATKLTKSASKRVQEYIKNAFNDSQLSARNLEEKFRKNFARLEVYFEALNFQHITESPAYTVTDFLSDFGGNIGLWLGWSVLALFEVVQFCYECLGICRNSR